MTARRTATIRLQLDTADAPLSADAARDVLGEAVEALADVAHVTAAMLDPVAPLPLGPNPTPREVIEAAARATVAAFPEAEDNGDGIPDLAWMLGGAVTYEDGLQRFAAEVIRAASPTPPTPTDKENANMSNAPTIDPHTIAEARALSDALHRETRPDTLNRARWRANVTFSAFYDDEPTEPDQAIRDALTDLLHEAEARGVDFAEAVERARHMYDQERAEWAELAAQETEGEADL